MRRAQAAIGSSPSRSTAKPRWRRILRLVLLFLIGVPTLYLLAAVGLAFIPVNGDFVEPQDGIEIQLVSNGIHVDFLLPITTEVMDWSQKLPRSAFGAASDRDDHVLFGWGNRVFYLETPKWSDLKVKNVFKAVFWPSDSVMHAQYIQGTFEEARGVCRSLRISETAYRKLCAYIDASFRHDASGAFELIDGKSYGLTDNFYEGVGSYHALNTCNSWTNDGLKEIGVRTALWSPFPFGILRHLR